MLPVARVVQQPSRKSQARIASRFVPRGWSATRSASRERRAQRVTNGSFAPDAGRRRGSPQAPTPKSTTRISGTRKPEELVAVAEIESGRNATASTSPSEMIESDDRLEPELDAGHPPQRGDLDDVVEPERQDRPRSPRRRRRPSRQRPRPGRPRPGRASASRAPGRHSSRSRARRQRPTRPMCARSSGQLVFVSRRASRTLTPSVHAAKATPAIRRRRLGAAFGLRRRLCRPDVGESLISPLHRRCGARP